MRAAILRRAVLHSGAAVVLLCAASAPAALMDAPRTPRERCEPVEYAELKDMSEASLLRAYCDTSALAAQRATEADLAAKLATAIPERSRFATRDAFERYAAACHEQQTRIGELYARQFGKAPACTAPPK